MNLPRWSVAIICYLSISIPLLHANTLPELGDPSSAVLTPQQERRLGESIMFQIRHSLTFSPDPWVQAYIQSLGNRLTTHNQDSQFPYLFFVVQDPSINAFALPGGFIGINTGLILIAQDEHELASVMAHESAHVSQHHIARLYAHMSQIQLSTVAGAIASVILATQDINAGSGALAATMAGQQQALLNFTRDNEKEADRIGIQLLHDANFNPYAMPRFFEKLWQYTQYYGQEIPEYLQTHPLTTSRIADSRARAEQWPSHSYPPDLGFLLIQTKIRAGNFKSPQEARVYFQKLLEKHPAGLQRIAAEYGLGVAMLSLGDPKLALKSLSPLHKQIPQQLLITASYAEALYEAGEAQQSFAILKAAQAEHPSELALMLQYNAALIAEHDAKTAVKNIRAYQLRYGQTPETLNLLSKAYAAIPDNTQMHLAQANYLVSIGDYRAALKQLSQAKHKIAKNSKLALQVDAKIDEIRYIIEQVEGRPLKDSFLPG